MRNYDNAIKAFFIALTVLIIVFIVRFTVDSVYTYTTVAKYSSTVEQVATQSANYLLEGMPY